MHIVTEPFKLNFSFKSFGVNDMNDCETNDLDTKVSIFTQRVNFMSSYTSISVIISSYDCAWI